MKGGKEGHHLYQKRDLLAVVYDMMVSSTEFEKLFNKFKAETGSVFRIKSSCSIAYENSRRKKHFIPSRFKFVTVRYCCVHYGQPKVAGQGIRTKQRSVEEPLTGVFPRNVMHPCQQVKERDIIQLTIGVFTHGKNILLAEIMHAAFLDGSRVHLVLPLGILSSVTGL